MYILPGDAVRQDVVYLAHPRTASVATRRTLSKVGPIFQQAGHHGYDLQFIPSESLIFVTIRNPWDLFISWWFKRQPSRSPFYGLPLEDFIPSLVKTNLQYFRDGKLFYMEPHANHILRFEHLQADFDNMLVQVGYPPRDLVVANSSVRRLERDYRQYYTNTARQWVADRFAPEIEKHGYKFD